VDRKTEAVSSSENLDPVTDQAEIDRIESENALRQFDYAMSVVESSTKSSNVFVLQAELICELNRLATARIKVNSGKLRQVPIQISNSAHRPPESEQVPDLLACTCRYVNENWGATPIHLAAYLLWRINWIHPFEDGNGRTARMISYVILCIRLGFVLPGPKTIPEQIARDKAPYYAALEAADVAHKKGLLDLRKLEDLLSGLLAIQLTDIHEQACGPSETTGP